ncbi:hypothetical protein VCHA48P437_10230 [Vibrio chagasii]|nr:hypothetical protein VCHA36P166_170031 [Vibrio chagasii]CAH7090955.1 hypothetical protein VCHA48P437_10230 [Vibrio chagasii]CAH7212337.1 hypothetical protein VCHA44O286_20136 [Vibrio chagasii]
MRSFNSVRIGKKSNPYLYLPKVSSCVLTLRGNFIAGALY